MQPNSSTISLELPAPSSWALPPPALAIQRGAGVAGSTLGGSPQALAALLADRLERKCGVTRGFMLFDVSRSGDLSVEELAHGMQGLNLAVSQTDAVKVANYLCQLTGSRKLDITTFIQGLERASDYHAVEKGENVGAHFNPAPPPSFHPPAPAPSHAPAPAIASWLRRELACRGDSTPALWAKLAPQRQGFARPDDFSRGLRDIGVGIDDAAALAVFREIDEIGSGRIRFNDFYKFMTEE